jgi:hypothetical protein
LTGSLQIFAGGKSCPISVIGENAVKVTVPKTVLILDLPKGKFVEFRAANEGGVSNTITVEITKIKPANPEPPMAKFGNPSLTIAFSYKNLGIVKVDEPNQRPINFTVNLDPSVQLAKGNVDIEFVSSVDKFKLSIPAGEIKNNKIDLTKSLTEKLVEVYSGKYGPENVNPIAEVKWTATIKAGTDEYSVDKDLTVKWVRVEVEK